MSNTIMVPMSLLPAILEARKSLWAASEVSIAEYSEALVASEHAVSLHMEGDLIMVTCAQCGHFHPQDILGTGDVLYCGMCAMGETGGEGWVCPCGQLCHPWDGFCQACGFGEDEEPQTDWVGSFPTEIYDLAAEEDAPEDWGTENIHEPRWACTCGEVGISDLLSHCPVCDRASS